MEQQPGHHFEDDRAVLGGEGGSGCQPAAFGGRFVALRQSGGVVRRQGPGGAAPQLLLDHGALAAAVQVDEAGDADRGGGEHGGLPHRVPGAEVDEDGGHDVLEPVVGDFPDHGGVGRFGGARGAATHMPTPMVAAAARAIGMRAARRQVLTVSWKWTGIRRSTSTKTIIETVSTQNWVSARSGAPWTTKSRAAP